MMIETNMLKAIRVLCICFALVLLSYNMVGQTMSVAPNVINLNTQGNYENIKGSYSAVIASTLITSHSIQVSFNGTYIMEATYVWYCPVDQILFVEFDRNVFQNHPAVVALANQGMKPLTIVGNFSVLTSTGNTIVYPVNRLGYAEIIKPGNKK